MKTFKNSFGAGSRATAALNVRKGFPSMSGHSSPLSDTSLNFDPVSASRDGAFFVCIGWSGQLRITAIAGTLCSVLSGEALAG